MGSGMTLDDALGRSSLDEAHAALTCFVANMQVWGSLGTTLCQAVDKDIELFLQKGMEPGVPLERLVQLLPKLAPERLASYHRQLSRSIVAKVRREFRQCISTIHRALEESPTIAGSDSCDDDTAQQLRVVVMSHLHEVESFLTVIYRFFKCVDLAGA